MSSVDTREIVFSEGGRKVERFNESIALKGPGNYAVRATIYIYHRFLHQRVNTEPRFQLPSFDAIQNILG